MNLGAARQQPVGEQAADQPRAADQENAPGHDYPAIVAKRPSAPDPPKISW